MPLLAPTVIVLETALSTKVVFIEVIVTSFSNVLFLNTLKPPPIEILFTKVLFSNSLLVLLRVTVSSNVLFSNNEFPPMDI